MTNPRKKESEQPLAMPEDSDMKDAPSDPANPATEPIVEDEKPTSNMSRPARRPIQEPPKSSDSHAEATSGATRTEVEVSHGNGVSVTYEEPNSAATKPSKLQKVYTETTKALGLTSSTPLEKELRRALDKERQEYQQHIQSQKSKYHAEIQRLQKQCMLRDNVINNQKMALRKAEDDNGNIQARILELEETVKVQEKSVADAQQRVLGMLDDHYPTAPDSETRRELSALERSIRTWSKEYSLKSISEWSFSDLSPSDIDELRFEWRGFAVVTDTGLPWPVGFDDPSVKNKAWMFISAWLADSVYQELFMNPFFFLELLMGEVDTGASETAKVVAGKRLGHQDMGRDMQDLLRGMMVAHGKNSNQVHTWRSLTLRLLDPQRRANMPKTAVNLKQSLKTAKVRLCSSLSEQFLAKSSRFLRSGEQTRASLETIMLKAADISFKMWTQKSYVELRGFAFLKEPFSRADHRLEPCALHTQELENDETALDGKTLMLICHPAVMVYGDSEGTDYSRCRVLKKAVIWAV